MMQAMMRRYVFAFIACLSVLAVGLSAQAADAPLRVVLIPADGGTEDGTKADFQPVFNAVAKLSGFTFELRVSQSYSAAVEAMCNGAADVAFLGPVTYVQAHQRGCAELLAVQVENGSSTYYSGIFVKKSAPYRKLTDLKKHAVAFGDINSTSSFVFPMTMLMEAGLDPAHDLAAIHLTGSHANSLAALAQGQADAAGLSFNSFEKAVQKGTINAADYRVLARSAPIPNPPLAVRKGLKREQKKKLHDAFAAVAGAPGISPDVIRGYGGTRVDRYDADFPEAEYLVAGKRLLMITDEMKTEILKRAAERGDKVSGK